MPPLRAIFHRLAPLLAVSTLAACSSRAPDTGGDTALAHDLARVQLRAIDAGQRQSASSAGVPPQTDTIAAPVESASAGGTVVPSPRDPTGAAAANMTLAPATRTCAVAGRTSQIACFKAQTAPSSSRLDQVYQSLLVTLRAQAPTRARARRRVDPPAVQQLRAAQQAWVALRARECQRRERGRGGSLWAPTRAQCYAEFSTARANELDATLARVRASGR